MPESFDGSECVDLSVLLPAHNEEDAIEGVIVEIQRALADWQGFGEDHRYRRCVDRPDPPGGGIDGSARCKANGERGLGSQRKTGVGGGVARLVAMFDADGTYDPALLPEIALLFFPPTTRSTARKSEQGTYKLLRVPAKWVIRKLAEIISGKRIPDLNTGMKVFKREMMLQYLWAIPDGFSCVTSMTLAFLCNGHPVRYVSVPYRKRIGKSKFHPISDSLRYFATVCRIVMYFRPLRVFCPIGVGLLLIALLKGAAEIWLSPLGLHDSDVVLCVSSLRSCCLSDALRI